jgi:hypothetical protein
LGDHIAFAHADCHYFPNADYVGIRHADRVGDAHCFADADRVRNTDRVPIADCCACTRPDHIKWAEHR